MKPSTLATLALALATITAACDRKGEPAPGMTNELKAPGLSNANPRGGVADDSVKPALPQGPLPNTKGGVPDDSVKPVLPNTRGPVGPVPGNPRGGIPDDSIKPAPKPH